MGFDRIETLSSPTGARLRLRVKAAEGAARGVVQVNHGLAEHGARYARFADFLAARGYHTYVHDHRGHGETVAADAPRGRFASHGGTDAVIADVLAVHDRIGVDHPGLPVAVFGHSMGGLIALNFVMRHPEHAQAVAIWNASVSPSLLTKLALALLAYERFRIGSDVPSRMMPAMTFQAWGRQIEDRRSEFDWLSRDADEVASYIADPLCGWDASVSMWDDVVRLSARASDDAAYARLPRALPFLLVGGAEDPATEKGEAVHRLARRMRRLGFSNLISTVYPGTRHESLNEVNRNIIMADFASWLDDALTR